MTRRTSDLIHILRRTLIELEQAEHPDNKAVQELKRSILRSIAEMETWDDPKPEHSSTSRTLFFSRDKTSK
jgi:hypothetical protein